MKRNFVLDIKDATNSCSKYNATKYFSLIVTVTYGPNFIDLKAITRYWIYLSLFHSKHRIFMLKFFQAQHKGYVCILLFLLLRSLDLICCERAEWILQIIIMLTRFVFGWSSIVWNPIEKASVSSKLTQQQERFTHSNFHLQVVLCILRSWAEGETLRHALHLSRFSPLCSSPPT